MLVRIQRTLVRLVNLRLALIRKELENQHHVQQCDIDIIVESLKHVVYLLLLRKKHFGLLIAQNILQVRHTNRLGMVITEKG